MEGITMGTYSVCGDHGTSVSIPGGAKEILLHEGQCVAVFLDGTWAMKCGPTGEFSKGLSQHVKMEGASSETYRWERASGFPFLGERELEAPKEQGQWALWKLNV